MSIMSMTGFGTGEFTDGLTTWTCEIRSVNSRFLEVNCKLPRILLALESEVNQTVKLRLARGKVDLFFDIRAQRGTEKLPRLNNDVLAHYTAMIREVRTALHAPDLAVDPVSLLRMEGVLEEQGQPDREQEIARHRHGLNNALEKALTSLTETRSREGSGLASALREQLDALSAETKELLAKRQKINESLYQTYLKRLESFVAHMGQAGMVVPKELPQDRLLTELAVIAEKTDIEEELARLAVHEQEFRTLLTQRESVGRKLDFLCQEIHREVNTVSSKLVQVEASTHTLAMKQAVERLRQQVQNVE